MRKAIHRIILVLVTVVLLAPMLMLLWATLHIGTHWSFTSYIGLFNDGHFRRAISRSIVVSLGAVVVSTIILSPSLYLIYSRFPNLLGITEGLTLMPFVIPGVSLAIGYITVYSSGFFPLSETPLLLPFAFSILGLPFFFRSYVNGLRMLQVRTLADAAASVGCGWWRTFLQIIVPNVFPAILGGALLVFALSMGEFVITDLTVGTVFSTFPVYMESIFMYNPSEGASMAALSYLITIMVVMMVGLFVSTVMLRKSRSLKRSD